MKVENITKIIDKMVRETGVDPIFIYDTFTGGPIGTIHMSEFEAMIDTIPDMDDDELIDELYVRTLSSMRPSPAWNMVRYNTLNKLRFTQPARVASYLTSRLLEVHDPATGRLKRSHSTRLDESAQKIRLFKFFDSLEVDPILFKQLLLVLLEIDSKFNLSKLAPPKGMLAKFESLESHLIPGLVEELEDWLESLIEKRAKADHQARVDATYWVRGGSSVTRDAFVKTFLEVKPKSEATKKRKAKDSADEEMLALLQEIMDKAEAGTDQPAVTHKPKPKPISGLIPAGMLSKLKLAKRN